MARLLGVVIPMIAGFREESATYLGLAAADISRNWVAPWLPTTENLSSEVCMAAPIKAGFWSYTHSDDEHENGRIVRLRERLERSIRFYAGIRDFRIFLDRNDIGWGQKWARRIADSLDDALLLFPIMTPSYFSSAPCREEALAFRARQSKLSRDDLILPIYYLASDLMDNTDDSAFEPEEREVGKLLREHQHEDWRALRVTEETDPSYGKAIERLAQQATKALRRGAAAQGHSGGRPGAAVEIANPATTLPTGQDKASLASAAVETSPKAVSSPPGHIVSLTVNQMPGRGNFTTISEAIARAPGGARIVVSPGHYRESLVIDRPLELVGDGSREDLVIESQTAATIIFDTNIGLVRNFTLRQSRLKGDDYCIWIKQGRLKLEDCDVSSAGHACIAVTNNADPRIRRNKIHNGNQGGVYIINARGTLEDNEILGNAFAGIEVKEGADPKVRRNRIHDGKQAGIIVHAEGRGVFEDNEIFGNTLAGIAVAEGADPIVRRNRVHDGKQGRIFVYRQGRGTFEDNDIFGNSNAGFEVKEGADPIVRRNRIHDGKGTGMLINGQGRGTLEDNDIFGNSFAGIEVKEGAEPIVRRNRIYDGKQSALFVHSDGRGTFEDNDVFGNSFAGIEVTEGGAPIVRRNRISKNAHGAIRVYKDGAGIFIDNDLTDNARGAWDIDASALPKVKRERNREK